MQWEDFLCKLNNFIGQVKPKLIKIILFAVGTYFPSLCKFDNVTVILITLCFGIFDDAVKMGTLGY